MAKDKAEVHQFIYTGPSDEVPEKPLEHSQTPPRPELAREIALSVLDGSRGRVHLLSHFQNRANERFFSVFQVTYVIRNGDCIGEGEYCQEYRDHKYKFRGEIDGIEFDAVFGLSADHHFILSPACDFDYGLLEDEDGKAQQDVLSANEISLDADCRMR